MPVNTSKIASWYAVDIGFANMTKLKTIVTAFLQEAVVSDIKALNSLSNANVQLTPRCPRMINP